MLGVPHLQAIAALRPAQRDAVRVLVTNASAGADALTLGALPGLRAVVSIGAGTERLDAGAAAARGIALEALGGYLTDDVADLVMAQLVTLSRGLREADGFVRQRRWGKEAWPLGRGLAGRRLGLMGYGRVGQAVARRAAAAGMHPAVHTRTPRGDIPWHPDLRSLAAASDALVLCAPGDASTRNAVGEAELAALGPAGLLVNVARGTLLDEAALIRALREGTIAGAALDVFLGEPDPDPELLACPNLLVTPHLGGATLEARARAAAMAAEAVARHLR